MPDDLNAQLLAGCREDERRQIGEQSRPVGALIVDERVHLLPLAQSGFELGRSRFRAWMDWAVAGAPISIGTGTGGQDGRGPSLSESSGST
jgi:hypothetical protein